jgi:hypothetical protein
MIDTRLRDLEGSISIVCIGCLTINASVVALLSRMRISWENIKELKCLVLYQRIVQLMGSLKPNAINSGRSLLGRRTTLSGGRRYTESSSPRLPSSPPAVCTENPCDGVKTLTLHSDYEYDDTKQFPELYDDIIGYIEDKLIAGIQNDLEDRFNHLGNEVTTAILDIIKTRSRQIHQLIRNKRQKPSIQETPTPSQESNIPSFEFMFPEFSNPDRDLLDPLKIDWLDDLLLP